ncbi:MAG: hypothetical protein ACE5I9_11195 [Candidatus Methylomirabilales bacterium]
MNPAKRSMAVAGILLVLGMAAHAQKAPPERELGVPIYPDATLLESFTEGPTARYLFGSNDITISVARFYEQKTGKTPHRIQAPDGTETYRFVLKGEPEAALPDLEVRVNHYPGGFTIPDEVGRTRHYSTTILISKKTR